MAGIAGQPGTKPKAAMAPNPQEEASAFLADFDAPQVPSSQATAPMVDAGQAEADAFLSDINAPDAPTEDQFAPEPGFIEANVDQFKPDNFITRVQAGLAANDTEKYNFLANKYGKENVALKKGNLYYRKDPNEKLKRLDPATFELISDILPDFGREIVTEGAMLPGEIGGAIVGSGAPVVGTAAGALTGRVASVPMANAFADSVASRAGVPTDPSRNQRTENAIGMAAETVLPVVGSKVVGTLAKRIPGTLAYKAAREAGEREIVALSKQSSEVLQAADELAKEGINVNLMSHQAHNTAPGLEAKAASVEAMGAFKNKEQEFAEGYGQALENTLTDIAREANPTKAKASATDIMSAVDSIDKLEGQTIGMYRNKAMAKLKNAKSPLPPETSQKAQKAMQEMGFVPKTVRKEVLVRPGSLEGAAERGIEARKTIERTEWKPPTDLSRIEGRLGMTEGQTRAMVNGLNEYGQYMSRGEARLTDIDQLVNRLGPMTKKLQGTQGGAVLSNIVGDLRQHRRAIISSGLLDSEKPLFNAAMDKFSMVRKNTENLGAALESDITSKAVVNHFFKAGAGPERVQALKAILGEDSPQWGALKEEFITQAMAKHMKRDAKTGFKSAAFLNDLEKNYGPEVTKEIFGEGGRTKIKNLLTVGERIEASQRGLKVDNVSEQTKKGIVEGFYGFVANNSYRMLNGARTLVGIAGDKESALMDIINRDGVEKYLTSYKGKNKGEIAKKVEGLLMEYNAARSASNKVNATLDIGKDIAKRGARGYVREGLEQ